MFIISGCQSKNCCKGLIGRDSSLQNKSVFSRSSEDALKTVTLSDAAASEGWWTAVTREALRILTAQVKLLLIQEWCVCMYCMCVCVLVLHTAKCASCLWCYLPWMCVSVCVSVCVCLCVSVWVSSLQRRLIRPWEYPVWQHIRTGPSLSSDILLSLLCCNSSTAHSRRFVQVPVLKGNDTTNNEICEFNGLPKRKMEKFSVQTRGGKTKRVKRFLWDYVGL